VTETSPRESPDETVGRVAGMLGMNRHAPSLGEHPEDGWRARAEAAEARLAAIAVHCRDRVNGPGRYGLTMAAAQFILGLAEGSSEETGDA
jgi:hypothetical protein